MGINTGVLKNTGVSTLGATTRLLTIPGRTLQLTGIQVIAEQLQGLMPALC